MKRDSIVHCSLGFFLALAMVSSPLYAEECSPFQFGLFPSIQLVPKDKIVCGVRLDPLWGDNAEVWGLDAGLVNIAGASRGLQIGGVNWLNSRGGDASWGIQVAGMNYTNNITYTGAQIAVVSNFSPYSDINGVQGGLFNFASHLKGVQLGAGNGARYMTGVQLAALINGAREMDGLQIAFYNGVEEQMRGVQLGLLLNEVHGDISGVQISGFNIVNGHVTGVQIGLFNLCKYLTGVQIGFINIVYGGGGNAIPFFPIINFGWY